QAGEIKTQNGSRLEVGRDYLGSGRTLVGIVCLSGNKSPHMGIGRFQLFIVFLSWCTGCDGSWAWCGTRDQCVDLKRKAAGIFEVADFAVVYFDLFYHQRNGDA